MKNSADRVAALLDDIRTLDPALYDVVQAVRATVREVAADATEGVMYGGIMFAADKHFCGVFAYKEHVSLEFGKGCDLDDPLRLLEGSGKLRRHLKLRSAAELQEKRVRDYVTQAYSNANPAGAGA
ncbi:DUF1801 domain-containing protein [Janthinobacterium fluminis]|uniref:DUF1801 domain-containing protein n=1 Tax=Janthinobacterium fluminis TaxID=2987524 RepID=A0ABT5JYE3_9BURK|nr:DUF1801 domain-containing protein [Janthinobacterium fluminis]MDC8757210.1 DUF1801 domain-containing protein [Janthinobacterium fluminis]